MHGGTEHVIARAQRVLRERVLPRIHRPVSALDVAVHELPGEPVPVQSVLGPRAQAPSFANFRVPGPWGGAWTTTWFRMSGTVPQPPPGRPLEAVIDLGWFDHSVGGHVEAMVYDREGRALKALHPRNGWVRVSGPGAPAGLVGPDGSFVLYVEAAANPLLLGVPPFVETELGDGVHAQVDEPYILRSAALCVFDDDVWQLARDIEVVSGLIEEVDAEEPRHWKLARALENCLDLYDEQDPDSVEPARRALSGVLSAPAHASAHEVSAVGHAHIDSAWLWPVREARRKVARTVANVLALMDQGLPLIFAMSSAQQYAWLEEDHPDLYARLAERVRRGDIVPVGGTWVEMDGMLPAGEAIVRQILLGVRDFTDRFGWRPREMWLPDSFGYNAALPQLARRAGFRWFLTQKLSWNDTTQFPHHSFWWQGLDGTRVFTHFPPSDTYAAEVTARELHHSVASFKEKAIADHSLLLFGYGDGGGGPTREMIGRLDRFRDLEGAPRVVEETPAAFFEKAAAQFEGADAPVWSGELYLELHRATLTTQAGIKQGNRRCEALLRAAEYLSVAARLRAGHPYPLARLERMWKTLLLNQFHDILPGSSIEWVNREARRDLASVEEEARDLVRSALAAMGADGGGEGRIVPFAARPQEDWAVARPGDAAGCAVWEDEDGHILSNGLLRVRVDRSGHVTSVRDLDADRELVPEGSAFGALQVFRDQPVRWDAWDLDRHVFHTLREVGDADSVEAVREPGRVGLRVHMTLGSSSFRQTWWLEAARRAVDVECETDWQEREHLLKIAFPLAVSCTHVAHETQYGWVERPVHPNTAHDEAQFETCTQRVTHVADAGYGVAVVNDSTYGADVSPLRGGTLVRPSLVRSPRFPEPRTDVGPHRFAWSIVVGADRCQALVRAFEFNAAPIAGIGDVEPLAQVEPVRGRIAIDWIKLAEDGSDDVIMRVYEPFGAQAQGALRLSRELASRTVVETSVLESPDDGSELAGVLPDGAVEAQGAVLRLRPFQMATLRFTS
jgi:alpha-mannosidase